MYFTFSVYMLYDYFSRELTIFINRPKQTCKLHILYVLNFLYKDVIFYISCKNYTYIKGRNFMIKNVLQFLETVNVLL